MICIGWRYLCVISLVVVSVYPYATLTIAQNKETIQRKWNVSLKIRELTITDKCKQGFAALDLDSFAVRVAMDTGNTDLNLLQDVLASYGNGEVICKFRVINRKCITESPRVHNCSCARPEPLKYDLIISDTLRSAHLMAKKTTLRSLSLVVRSTQDHLPNISRVVLLSNISFSQTPEFSFKVDGAEISLDRCIKTYPIGSKHTFQFCTQGLHKPMIWLGLFSEKRETSQRECAFMDMRVRKRYALVGMAYRDACGRAGTYNCTIIGYGQDHEALVTSLLRQRGLVTREQRKHIEAEKDNVKLIILTVTGVCMVIIAACLFFGYTLYVLRGSRKSRNSFTFVRPDLKI